MSSNTSSFFATWGCLMLAYTFDAVLYGAGMLLMGQYFMSARMSRDSRYVITTVILLGLLGTIQIAFLSHQIFFDFVINFGDNDKLANIPFSATVMLLAICLIAFVAQLFYTTRIWLISSRSIAYTAPIVVLAFLQISSGFAQTILDIKEPQFSKFHRNTSKVHSTQSAAAAVCDIAITAILCYKLHGSKSGMDRTNTVIDKMIKYAIHRGAATSFCALLNLIFFMALPKTFIFMVPLLPSGQLYIVSVISMLIARQDLRNQINSSHESNMSFPLSSIRVGDNNSSMANETSGVDGVHIQKQVLAWSDA